MECGDIKQLCPTCPRFTAPPEDPKDPIIVFGRMSANDELVEIMLDNVLYNSTDFRIKSSSEEFYITNTGIDYNIRNTVSLDSKFSNLSRIYNLNIEKLKEGKYSLNDLEKDLGTDVSKDSRGRIVIDLYKAKETTETIGRIKDPCKNHINTVVNSFTKHLNDPIEVFPENQASIWMDNLEFYISRCIDEERIENPSFDLTKECVDARCVIENMVDFYNNVGNEEEATAIQANYLGLYLDLNEEMVSELASSNNPSIEQSMLIFDETYNCQNQDQQTTPTCPPLWVNNQICPEVFTPFMDNDFNITIGISDMPVLFTPFQSPFIVDNLFFRTKNVVFQNCPSLNAGTLLSMALNNATATVQGFVDNQPTMAIGDARDLFYLNLNREITDICIQQGCMPIPPGPNNPLVSADESIAILGNDLSSVSNSTNFGTIYNDYCQFEPICQ